MNAAKKPLILIKIVIMFDNVSINNWSVLVFCHKIKTRAIQRRPLKTSGISVFKYLKKEFSLICPLKDNGN
jgi:hypothetical protein